MNLFLKESLTNIQFINFQLDTTLQKIYNYLQRFAVGLEEIVLDQALFDGEFIQEFNEAEYKLKAVSIETCTVTKQVNMACKQGCIKAGFL